ncbi:MAG: glycogen/starch synthase [Candidatus Hodarchaeales archaeon]
MNKNVDGSNYPEKMESKHEKASKRSQEEDRGRSIIFITFENEFAPCGGLSAVMRYLPRKMAATERTAMITPFFSRIDRCLKAYNEKKLIQPSGHEFNVNFGSKEYSVELLKYEEPVKGSIYTIYFIRSDGFFLAPEDPYINPGDPEKLFKDSLFFSAVVPRVLEVIPEKEPYILHLQDWETACIAGTIPETIIHECFLTLHNPYDHSLTNADLERIGARTVPVNSSTTVLHYALDRVRRTSTVSTMFAEELTGDPLHNNVFIPHLQESLSKNPVLGIENGNFTGTSLSARSGVEELIRNKTTSRMKLVALLDSIPGQKMVDRSWGNCDLSDPGIPLFLMFGRDDPRQKGYDIAAQAVREILQEKGSNSGRFVFTPIPGQKGLDSLQFLKNLAMEHGKSVMVFPFRMDVGYNELQQSSSYLLMPSFYEPFGGATEGYSSGVPVIARATGGLIQQVDPVNFDSLPSSIQDLVIRFNGVRRKPTGFLFRERTVANTVSDWSAMIKANYLEQTPIGDPVEERKAIPLFRAMVDSAKAAIETAIDLYTNDIKEYGKLITNGIMMLEKFSWKKAVDRYRTELYK